ncbi:MAG: hypothetical protein C5B47_08040 [Verrucomicrobia bacterium]|nr:MAG: hypothetical protein C5B47_08040 [Verrucomicrobiota bacterium]
MSRLSYSPILIVFLKLAFFSSAYGQTNFWANGVGAWETPANWALKAPPTNSQTAWIQNGGTALITDTTIAEANALDLGQGSIFGGVVMSGGSLSVNSTNINSLNQGSTFLMQGGIYTNSTTIIIGFPRNCRENGHLIIEGGVINTSMLQINRTGNSSLQLNGGILITDAINGVPCGTGSNIVPIINGGTLQARSNGMDLANLPIYLGPAGGTIDTNGNSNTMSSALSGPGGLTVIGNGNLTATGNHSYFGDTNVNNAIFSQGVQNAFSPNSDFAIQNSGILDAGGFDGTIGALSGNGIVTNNGSNSATLTLGNTNHDGVFDGTIQSGSAPLAIIKIGSGTQILTGNNSFSGPTNINNGELTVNGQMPNSNVFVNPGAILSGVGNIGGSTLNIGIVSPGYNGPGTLTVGPYTQDPGAVLLIQLASTTSHDLLAVNGPATLAGTLQIETLPGFVAEPCSEITILTATGGVNGTFSNVLVTTDFPYLLVYNPNNVQLRIPCIDTAVLTDTVQQLEVLQVPFSDLVPWMDGTVKDILFNVTNIQYNQLIMRLLALRAGSRGMSLQGLTQEPMLEQLSKHEGKMVSQNTNSTSVAEPSPWNIFAWASGIFSKIDSAWNLPSTNSMTGFFGAGADHFITPNWNVGIYTGYQGTKTWFSESSSLRSNGVKFGLYSTAEFPAFSQWIHWNFSPWISQWSDNFYLNAIVGGGTHFVNFNRSINVNSVYTQRYGRARSNTFIGELDSLLGGGYEIQLGPWQFGINNSIQYTYLGISAFNEYGAGNLNVKTNSQNPNSLIYTLGGNISYLWKPLSLCRIFPTIGLYWQHEFLNYGQRITGQFANGQGTSFGFYSLTAARNNALAVAGLEVAIGSRCGVYAYYTPQFGGGQIAAHSVLVGLNYSF